MGGKEGEKSYNYILNETFFVKKKKDLKIYPCGALAWKKVEHTLVTPFIWVTSKGGTAPTLSLEVEEVSVNSMKSVLLSAPEKEH